VRLTVLVGQGFKRKTPHLSIAKLISQIKVA